MIAISKVEEYNIAYDEAMAETPECDQEDFCEWLLETYGDNKEIQAVIRLYNETQS